VTENVLNTQSLLQEVQIIFDVMSRSFLRTTQPVIHFAMRFFFYLRGLSFRKKTSTSVFSKIKCGLKLWMLMYVSITFNLVAAHEYISLRLCKVIKHWKWVH
jgi:hypothetical protein